MKEEKFLMEGISNYAQRKFNPAYLRGGVCNVTSAANLLISSGINFDFPNTRLPEYLYQTLYTEEGFKVFMKSWFYGKSMREYVATMLNWVINKFLKEHAHLKENVWAIYRDKVTVKNLIDFIDRGFPTLFLGSFLNDNRKLDHYAVITGYLKNDDRIEKIILTDGWGDWNTNYTNKVGYKVYIDIKDFKEKIYHGITVNFDPLAKVL